MAIAGDLAPKRGTHVGVGLFHPSMALDMAEPFTVLFVEDDVAVRIATAELLASKGFHILVAPDGATALRLLAEHPVDVLFTDVVMPDLDGITLVRQAKRLRPDLKVMLMTGYYSRAAEAQKLGKLLFKPVRGDQLEAELRGLARAE